MGAGRGQPCGSGQKVSSDGFETVKLNELPDATASIKLLTVNDLTAMKRRGEKISCLTAYDADLARLSITLASISCWWAIRWVW